MIVTAVRPCLEEEFSGELDIIPFEILYDILVRAIEIIIFDWPAGVVDGVNRALLRYGVEHYDPFTCGEVVNP